MAWPRGGLNGYVQFKRYKSDDDWSFRSMEPGSFSFSRRGKTESVKGLGAELPRLKERAGKYEYYALLGERRGDALSVTGDRPIYARYKAPVPFWALVVHIAVIFASMVIAIRTTLEALVDGNFKWMLWATIVSLLLGGFVKMATSGMLMFLKEPEENTDVLIALIRK